jgi:hypothetical protein
MLSVLICWDLAFLRYAGTVFFWGGGRAGVGVQAQFSPRCESELHICRELAYPLTRDAKIILFET